MAATSAPKRVRLMPLVALIFFSVSGGAYGIEGLLSTSGPGMSILLIVVAPLICSVPHSLVVAERGTALPVEGGYYHWVKKGLGKFFGFQQACAVHRRILGDLRDHLPHPDALFIVMWTTPAGTTLLYFPLEWRRARRARRDCPPRPSPITAVTPVRLLLRLLQPVSVVRELL